MCGIFGIAATRSETRFIDDAVSCGLNAISFRGPDAHGVIREKHGGFDVALVNTRLSIIDLSDHGAQPMRDDASKWSIAYNGEIYNYLEIRDELRTHGWSFHGHSDTEVLLKAWIQWGLGALNRLNGMFAFAVFNSESGEMWLVRDRFGVKPLLWGKLSGGGLVFSSSVAAIASLAAAKVDVSYCMRGVCYRAFEVPGSEAPFCNVNAVSAGGWLKCELKEGNPQFTEGRWYSLTNAVNANVATLASSSEQELAERCAFLLEDSVKLRLRSDVPVAVSLSGGVDSSSVAAIAARHVNGLTGFTYGEPSALQSEGPQVELFSKSVGINARYIWHAYGAADLSRLLERTLVAQEAPFGGLSVMAQNEVFKIVRESGFKVLLGGQGGDEVFAGYRKFFVVALKEALHHRRLSDVVRLVYSMGSMLYHEAAQARLYWQNLNRYRAKTIECRVLNWNPIGMNLWGDKANAGPSLSLRQIEDVQRWSIPTLLRYEDRNSMGHSVETRLPFMDYRLVEFAIALPALRKISHGFGKWMLRKAVAGTVPDSTRLNRKKRGFDVTQQWIEDGLGEQLRENILSHKEALKPHLKPTIDLGSVLSNANLAHDRALLDEALMLAWLIKPIRLPK